MPAPHDFIPSREADLLAWSRVFSAKINADPTQFNLTPLQAAEYAALHDAYAAAYTLAKNTSTNSKANVQTKNDAKAALKDNARLLARIIRATPTVTNDQRVELGLTVPDEHLTPVTVPVEPPLLMLMSTMGRRVRVRLRDQGSSRRGKPAGTIGAVVLSYVAPLHSPEEINPPNAISKWSYCGNANRSTFDVNFASDVPPGSKVWLAACWVNTRGQNGPMSAAVSTRIGEGVGHFGGALRLAA